MWRFATLFSKVASAMELGMIMLSDQITAKERLKVPLAWRLRQLKARFLNFFQGKKAVNENEGRHQEDHQDEDFSWIFASEDEEHRYFDNIDRAHDIRSAFEC